MFSNVHRPEVLTPEELDAYLEMGWFRMGQTIFTTNFLYLQDNFYSALWLRVVLPEYSSDSTQQKLTNKNAGFRTEVQKAVITPEKEVLYAAYRRGISFEVSPTLQDLLRSYGSSIYDTYEVTLYDGEKLIATGFFDMGGNSAAGITSFYDHDYKKYSPGKYLIYVKMDYCRSMGLQYFYPGYFAPGANLFSYKLEMGASALEFREFVSQQWLPIAAFKKEHNPLQVMRDNLELTQSLLADLKIESNVMHYEFLNVNSVPELMGSDLFDFPVFLYRENKNEVTVFTLMVFDVKDQHYKIIKCESIWLSGAPNKNGVFSAHLLKMKQLLYSAPGIEKAAMAYRDL